MDVAFSAFSTRLSQLWYISVNRTDEWRSGIEARLWLSEAPHLMWADQNMDSRTMKPVWQVLSSDEVDKFIHLFVERSLHSS